MALVTLWRAARRGVHSEISLHGGWVGGKAAVALLENSELRELHSRLYWQCQHDTQFPVGSAEFIIVRRGQKHRAHSSFRGWFYIAGWKF